jgi:hypothetical protein
MAVIITGMRSGRDTVQSVIVNATSAKDQRKLVVFVAFIMENGELNGKRTLYGFDLAG